MSTSIWYKDMGFHTNPLSIKPAAFSDTVFGYDKVVDEISQGILNNRVVVLEGAYGNGKSTILRRILNDFGGKKQVIYYSCNRMDSRLDVKALLNGRYGFFGKLFDLKPKDMIFLLDEAHTLTGKDYERLQSYMQEGFVKAVVLVGQQIDTKSFPVQWKSKVQQVSLTTLTEAAAVQIVRKRIGDLALLPDDMIKEIYKLSESNVRLLLKNCEEACKRAVETGRKKISTDFLRQVFPQLQEKKEAPAVVVEKKAVVEEKPTPVVEKPVEKHHEKAHAEKKETKKEEKHVAPETEKKGKVYKPQEYKSMMQRSAEELLSSPTEEILGDEEYY